MAVNILTKEDLQQFKSELLTDIKALLQEAPNKPKKWLKSYEVRELLGISPGTLQNMQENEILIGSKIGGLMFFDYDDIMALMVKNKKPLRR